MNERGITTSWMVDDGTADRTGAAERLARIGVALDAQRTEVFRRAPEAVGVHLVGWWTAIGHVASTFDANPDELVPLDWFPWSLGNIRPTDYVFVRNAAPLPLRPAGTMRIRDLGMGSCLHLPLRHGMTVVGALCVYWSDERDDWDADAVTRAQELGLSLVAA